MEIEETYLIDDRCPNESRRFCKLRADFHAMQEQAYPLVRVLLFALCMEVCPQFTEPTRFVGQRSSIRYVSSISTRAAASATNG